ncbi:L-ribulose-5-phosphate 4-epimerase [Alicyclobacillaceae bacterium I2511]|nr:L-ribulose-5-phosphate 4-epimerase [Alicyclobacillaceae bacterium I2511]
MFEELKRAVWQANLALPKQHLVTFTWGNVSGVDRDHRCMVIKPSGVPYEDLQPEDMVVLDLDGKRLEGDLNPSSDTPTHLRLYREFPEIGGIVHTHSHWATVWAQAGRNIPVLGTTHADDFYGEIPCTREMTHPEVGGAYEIETAHVMIETLMNHRVMDVPGMLVKNHGPFCWGKNPQQAVHNAVVLEEVARLAYHTLNLNPQAASIAQILLDRHFLRKHGSEAYYGQSSASAVD